MKLSSKGNYALIAMVELARKQKDKPIPLRVIAEDLGLSNNYLRQLFMDMAANGIVDSIRGPNGGYYLSNELDRISVLQIIEAVEGELQITDCIDEDDYVCSFLEVCPTHELWMRLNQKIREELQRMTLQELVRLDGLVTKKHDTCRR